MAVLADFFTAIKTQIEAEVTDIKTVRLFNNQYNNDNQESAFPYPNVFIEFADITWTSTTAGNQEGELTVRLYIGFESLEDEDLAILDTIEQVFAALHGFQGADFTALQRTEEVQDIDHGNVIVWQQEYTTNLTDCSAHVKQGLVEATVTTLEVNTDLDIDYYVIRTGDGDFTP